MSVCSCDNKQQERPSPYKKSVKTGDFDLPDIEANGEIIILSTYGPNTFFEYKGSFFGIQYMVVNEYAKHIGCTTRVEVCKDNAELISRLRKGDGDVAVASIPLSEFSSDESVEMVGSKQLTHFLDSLSIIRKDNSLKAPAPVAWATRKSSSLLCQSLGEWMAQHDSQFFDYITIKVRGKGGKTYRPQRKVYSPILNQAAGQISIYDSHFKRYAQACGWDWRLLAAQAYQESAFDAHAVSYMGAMGLMQLMPGTARSVGVSEDEVFTPEANIRGAVKFINTLNKHYSYITNPQERINFILGAYNAGPGHVDDARRLAEKNGKNPNVWLDNVDYYVLHMSEQEYYNDAVVKHGYFRGSETYNYVSSIRVRWDEYRRKIK